MDTLGKEKKRVDKAVAEHKASQPAPGTVSVDKATLKEALQMLRQETDKPTNPQEMEKYFMKAIGQGEALAAQGTFFSL
jgi:import receptor subunit TOM20